MHRINYFFIALIFLFVGIFIGMFVTTWHYLDYPAVKEVDEKKSTTETYMIQYKTNYFFITNLDNKNPLLKSSF